MAMKKHEWQKLIASYELHLQRALARGDKVGAAHFEHSLKWANAQLMGCTR